MIINHQKFDFGGKPLVEKIVIQAPFQFNASFQNEGCFIYFSEGGGPKIFSAAESTQVEPTESVLLKCGNYLADLLKSAASDKYEIIVIHLHHDILKRIYFDKAPKFLKADSKSPVIKVNTSRAIQHFVQTIQFYFENPALVDDELLEVKVRELIILLLKTRNPGSLADLFSHLFTPREITIKEIIETHLFSPLSVEDLASLANMSLSTFNRAFRETFNEPPASYLKSKRLERARDLLLTTRRPASEIAYETGFNDLAHFSRSFKDQFNQSPSKYRKL